VKVVITDHGYEHINQERKIIEGFGAELAVHACKTEQDVIDCASNADAIICQFAPITRHVIEQLNSCKVIIRYAVGVDNIDVIAASEKGIPVCNVPDYGTEEVALHTVSLILSLVRKLPELQSACRAGKWTYKVAKPIHRLSGQTLGLVGFGRIPRMVARMVEGFNLNILVADPYVQANEIEQLGYTPTTLEELIAQSDIISLHVPLSKKTYHIIDYTMLIKAQKNPYLINTSRGGIVDEQALLRLLDTNILAGVALDVSEKEPIQLDNPLVTHERVMITPHSAWYSEESISALQKSVAEEAVRVLSGNNPLHPVNR